MRRFSNSLRSIAAFIMAFVAMGIHATDAAPMGESVNYRVMFKWGLINKQAGHVNISTTPIDSHRFESLLTAATEPWADSFYTVRDTLRGHMSRSTLEPTLYEKITHEGGEYKRDVINYTRSGNHVEAECIRYVQKKSTDPITSSTITLEAEGLTIDMLSAFYYMRSLNYADMETGASTSLTVFSGKRKEVLTITYHGHRTIKIGNVSYPTFYITFKFTGDGGRKTSDDMNAWISTDDNRIPLKLEGKLPVGKVQCYYIP